MSPLRNYVSSLVGFAAALVGAAVVLAIGDAVSFRSGGEFDTAWQRAAFDLLVWGGGVLVCSGGGFALVVSVLVPAGRALPLPAFVGFVAGSGVVAVAGVGIVNRLHGVLGLPWPVVTAIPGVMAGCCAVAVAFLAAFLSARTAAGA